MMNTLTKYTYSLWKLRKICMYFFFFWFFSGGDERLWFSIFWKFIKICGEVWRNNHCQIKCFDMMIILILQCQTFYYNILISIFCIYLHCLYETFPTTRTTRLRIGEIDLRKSLKTTFPVRTWRAFCTRLVLPLPSCVCICPLACFKEKVNDKVYLYLRDSSSFC